MRFVSEEDFTERRIELTNAMLDAALRSEIAPIKLENLPNIRAVRERLADVALELLTGVFNTWPEYCADDNKEVAN